MEESFKAARLFDRLLVSTSAVLMIVLVQTLSQSLYEKAKPTLLALVELTKQHDRPIRDVHKQRLVPQSRLHAFSPLVSGIRHGQQSIIDLFTEVRQKDAEVPAEISELAPNTRETIRRQTMHQFVEAGIAVPNPDKPDRPINSPKWVYQISPDCLNLIRTFNTSHWNQVLAAYLVKRKTLTQRYAKARQMQLIPLKVNDGYELYLTPGAHSELIKAIIEQFGPRFTPGAEVLYVGETGSKMGHFDESTFKELYLNFDSHGKFPDVVLYQRDKNWLILVEAVTSHGPVDAKRHSELATLFSDSKAKIIYVTAFPDRQTLAKYLPEISWETEVWVVDTPTHLVHFDGVRFLGPYEE